MQIIVLGMHRSGTSLVTGLLGKMGADLGPGGVDSEVNAGNPKGFFERRDVIEINDDLLAGQGAAWYRPASFPIGESIPIPQEDTDTRIKALIGNLDARRPWVIKDPRLCLTFPIWRARLEAPVCVLVYRSPLEVAQSLKNRDDFPIFFGLALWEYYTLAALVGSVGMPRIWVSHRQMVEDPVAAVGQFHQALQACGLTTLRRPSPEEIADFVDPALHRARGTPEEQDAFLTPAQRHLWALLETHPIIENADAVPPLSQSARETLQHFGAMQEHACLLSGWMERVADASESMFKSRRFLWGRAMGDALQRLCLRPDLSAPEETEMRTAIQQYKAHRAFRSGLSFPLWKRDIKGRNEK
jgi:hypothetical protein